MTRGWIKINKGFSKRQFVYPTALHPFYVIAKITTSTNKLLICYEQELNFSNSGMDVFAYI